ncbi:MAG: helix-turn-helix domain-containing protein [Oscillatoria sp. PMC 1068.18]|nr:helix-turn-helix domain-containing protein [Oscillatoria sp. PMC 1076.18]MEC4988736.1 helix-turn-helix domain-containing protein [Oscillatoria sp. PMC 1068.18]
MGLQSVSCINAHESTTIEITQEGLRSILNQIETELLESEVYRSTLAGLQTMLGEAVDNAQILVKAVGREAIRLAFRQMAKQYNLTAVVPQTEDSSTSQTTAGVSEEVSGSLVEEITSEKKEKIDSELNTELFDFAEKPLGVTKPSKKLTKAEQIAQKTLVERQEILSQIGQRLQQARLAQSLSLEQLSKRTLVPRHHLQAIEQASIAELPEDVYVRGFIRRMANELGFDGSAIAASLPTPVTSVIPSWYHQPKSGMSLELNSVHLYLGYAGLVAGAIGGLAIISERTTPQAELPPASTSAAQEYAENHLEAELAELEKSAAGAEIAPPESF